MIRFALRLAVVACAGIALLLPSRGQAQIVLTRDAYVQMLKNGTESYSALNAYGTWFNTGTPGSSSNTYDFDQYAFEAQPALVTEYQTPGAFPYDTLFPGATHVIVTVNSGTFYNYNYMELTDSSILYRGDASVDQGSLIYLQVYEPPLPIYTFPVHVGQSGTAVCTRRNHLGRTGTIAMEYVVESAGNLIAPQGSTPALLMRNAFTYTDSVFTGGPPRVEMSKFARLDLINPAGSTSYVSVDTSTVFDEDTYVYSVTYNIMRSPSAVMPLPDVHSALAITSVYPNPVSSGGMLDIRWTQQHTSAVTVELYDALGRCVERTTPVSNSRGPNSYALRTMPARPGLYFLVLRSPDGMSAVPVRVVP